MDDCASLIVLVLCAWGVLHALRWRLPALLWLAIGVYLLSWGPAAAFSLTAQISLLLAGPVTAAWIAARQGHHARAGAWLGLAAAIKPFLFIFVPYFIVKRNWPALRSLALVAAATAATGVLVFGFDAYREWFSQLPRINWATHYFNASIAGVAERLFGRSYYAIVGRQIWIERMLILTATAVVAGVTFRRLARRRAADGVEPTDVDWAVLLMASLLLSPLGWVYYLWILLGPAGRCDRTQPVLAAAAPPRSAAGAGPGRMALVRQDGRMGTAEPARDGDVRVHVLLGAAVVVVVDCVHDGPMRPSNDGVAFRRPYCSRAALQCGRF